MAEYITKEQVAEWFRAYGHTDDGIPYDTLVDDIMDMPAADVAPVRHEWWLHSHYEDCSEHFEIVKCSNCGCEAYAMALYVRGGNYCPNCGARMDGARNGEEKD